MDDGWFFVLLLLLVLSIFEFVLFSFSAAYQQIRIKNAESLDEICSKNKRIKYISDHYERYLDGIYWGITANNLFMGAIVAYIHIDDGIAFTLPSALVTVIFTTAFDKYFARKIAVRSPEKWAGKLSGFVKTYLVIITPFIFISEVVARFFLIILGIRDSSEDTDVTEKEIISMITVGHEQGVLEESEATMLTNIFEYGDKEAKDVMTNRNNMVCIDAASTLEEASEFVMNAHNSRFPVYEETIDHIIGILYLKDVMRMKVSEKNLNRQVGKIKGLLREPLFVTETRKIDDLLKNMQSEKMQMAIVIDEYGQTAGLVALEDILEEIVGEIEDEYDEEETHIEERGNNEYVIDGMLPLEFLEDRFSIDFSEVECETVNGLVISKLEHIPEEDEEFSFVYGNYEFSIISVKDKMVQSVLLKKVVEDNLVSDESDCDNDTNLLK